MVVGWNDPEALIAATERYELAAILAEPLPANMGSSPPREGFLELLRERADANGALLVLDEVISGFRVAPRRRAGAHRRDRRSDDPRARSSAAACRPRRSAAGPS